MSNPEDPPNSGDSPREPEATPPPAPPPSEWPTQEQPPAAPPPDQWGAVPPAGQPPAGPPPAGPPPGPPPGEWGTPPAQPPQPPYQAPPAQPPYQAPQPGYQPQGVYAPPATPPKKRGRGKVIAGVAAVAVLAAAGIGGAIALSGGDDGGGGLVGNLDDAESATIQIISQGTFEDPSEGVFLDATGAGSGFIIDPSGIAVTNNHVVTGAATLEVVIGGDLENTLNAKILATSECSDLAVIDIDGGDFPYFEFYQGDITAGTAVQAAGFPLGDPQYTRTGGQVSKADASGETPWASVDKVIEHDATINPGNSGGPLLNEDGQVVAVNYAGDDSANQYFAIAPPELTAVVADLRQSKPVDWLGINGQAVASEDGSIRGVWVAAVESGSPASDLGLASGDLIQTLEGITLADDGTMADYCDVLRTQGADAELAAQVLRTSTGEIFEGSFNSGEEMQLASVPEPPAPPTTEPGGGGGGGESTYSAYAPVQDDTGAVTVDVPDEWSDRLTTPTDSGSPRIVATTDLDGFSSNFSTSGVFLTVEQGGGDPDQLLDGFMEQFGAASTACPTSEGRQDYDDGVYTGRYEVLTGCDGVEGYSFVGIAALPEDGSQVIFIGIQVINQADIDAIDKIIASFRLL